MKLIELLKQNESKTLEFKQDLNAKSGIIKSIIAFANTAGGILLIGVEDKTKHIHGVASPLKAEEALSNLVYDNIEPKLIVDIELHPWRDKYLLKIEVFPSQNRPHYYKKFGLEQGTFVRVGSTNRKADSVLINEMKRYQRLQSHDEEAYSDLSSEAIDTMIVSEYFSTIKKLTSNDLVSLGVLSKQNKKLVPTVGGMILFGKDRLSYFPDARFQVGRFEGLDKSNIADSQLISSYPVKAIEDAMDFVKKHSYQQIKIDGLRNKSHWNVPLIAIREAIINAVVHADYAQTGSYIRLAIFDDRIEIDNPGLLLFGLTIDDLIDGISKLRNRVIAKVFHKLGLIEQWGSGVKRIINECKKAGLANPKFEELATHFRVTIFLIPIRKYGLDTTEQKIVQYLKSNSDKGATTSDIAKVISLSTRATRTRLKKMIEAGLIIEIASSENDPNRQYYVI